MVMNLIGIESVKKNTEKTNPRLKNLPHLHDFVLPEPRNKYVRCVSYRCKYRISEASAQAKCLFRFYCFQIFFMEKTGGFSLTISIQSIHLKNWWFRKDHWFLQGRRISTLDPFPLPHLLSCLLWRLPHFDGLPCGQTAGQHAGHLGEVHPVVPFRKNPRPWRWPIPQKTTPRKNGLKTHLPE